MAEKQNLSHKISRRRRMPLPPPEMGPDRAQCHKND